MNVVWSTSARRNLADIIAYVAIDNPRAAVRLDDLIVGATARLRQFPAMGKSGSVAGTRELLPHPSYRVVYQIGENAVTVLAVVHTARQWPPLMDESG